MPHLDPLYHIAPSDTPPATLEKPTLSLHPPWTTIFKGERVTLRCDGYHPLVLELRPISTLWYLGHLLLPSHGKTIEVQTPGVYRCQTRGAPVSDPVHLSVSNGECTWHYVRGAVGLPVPTDPPTLCQSGRQINVSVCL